MKTKISSTVCSGEGTKSSSRQHASTQERHRCFAREYVASGFNATRAAVAAGYSSSSAASQGAKLLKDPRVQDYVRECSQRVVEHAEVRAEEVVRRLHEMLMADPRDLVEVHVSCCRHCYGTDHEYQYTHAEYNAKREKWIDAGKHPEDFPELGGVGYEAHRPAMAQCPECFGAGLPRTVVKDTRGLGRGALALFGGAKEGKYGTEISIRNQLDVIEKLMRYHGLYQRDGIRSNVGVGRFEVRFIEPSRHDDDPRQEGE
ncbi:MAG: terminase small subunit [Pseudomonas sp.]|uniref:terminase small subunit n=1 Tax=Pseudomonadota TaxID=1224 RepID=UPI000474CD67|nr:MULTISPECIES: terminase small subunit [Pseudomonadota]MPT02067.1 terminase small subunit [Pseudomonas sp.]MPT52542.1 terminase small subunit [Delftia sp.]SFB65082.1 Terminase small subunit [Delftia tsuruhatensis]